MNIYDEVNKIANGNARLKNSKLNNGSNSSIYDEMSQLSNKKIKLKNNSILSNTIQEKTDNLWVESTAPNVLEKKNVEIKPLNIKDFISDVKTNTKDRQNKIEQDILKAGYKSEDFTDEEKKMLLSGEYSINPTYTPESKYAKKIVYSGKWITPKDIEELNEKAPLSQKIDKAIKYDIPTAIKKTGNTVMDLGANVVTGATNAFEGMADAAVGNLGAAASGVTSGFGLAPNSLSEKIKKGAEDFVRFNFSAEDILEEKKNEGVGIYEPKILGMKVRDGLNTISNMITSVAFGGPLGFTTSAAGQNIEEALLDNQSLNRAVVYGDVAGAIEGLTEKMFDAVKLLGGGKFDKFLPKGAIAKLIGGAGGEAIEEVISDGINPFLKYLTYEKGTYDMPSLTEYLNILKEAARNGFVLGLIMKGGQDVTSPQIREQYKEEIYTAVDKSKLPDNIKEIVKEVMTTPARAQNNQDLQKLRNQNPQTPNTDIQLENVKGLPKIKAQNQTQNVPTQQPNVIAPKQAEMPQNANMNDSAVIGKMAIQKVDLPTQKAQKTLQNAKNDNFHKGLEKFNSKKYTQNDDMVVLDETPQYLYNLGFDADKPLVINMSKLETIMKEPKGTFDGKNQHGITMDVVEQLPKALQNPLNVIKNPKHNERVVVITELTDQYGDIIIVPIEMNTDGYIENIENNVNRINTVYGKENYDIPKEGNDKGYIQYNEDKIIYDIDKDITKKRDINSDYRLQLPSTAINISNNSINQNDSSVNTEYAQENENYTTGKEPAFSIPKNEVQTFASSTAPRAYMDLNRYTSRNKDSQAEKVGLTDIQKAINDIVTVKTGKFRQQAYGIYKTNNEIIRLKETKDIPVALHELTHHLDKKYNLSSSDKAFKELESIAVTGKNPSKQTVIKEGAAEFGRYYMTDKEYAKQIAPFYYDAFERALDNDPDMKSKVDNIRQMVSNYLEQSPLNRLSSNIDYGDNDMSLWEKGKESIIKTAKNFRKNFFDELDPLKKIVEEISNGDKIMTKENAYKLLRLNNGVTGKVQVALEYGVLDKNGEKVGKSLKEILKPVAGQQKEFVAYVTALRAKDLQGRGIESGILPKDVDDVIKSYNTNEKFNLAAKELYQFQNKILETTLIDSGIITREALEAYNKNNPHYVPFYRVMDENYKQSKSSKSKTPKRIKGSTRDIINPLESIIKNTYSYMQMAERNDAFKTLFDMANKYDGTGKWFDKVPADITGTKITAEDVKGILEQLNLSEEDANYNEIFTTIFKPANNQKGNIVTVMEKGKPVHYEINDKELFDILSPTVKGENIIVKLLSPASKALRVGATHTPEFVLRNPLRDTIDAGIYSKNGFIPFVDTIKGIFDVAGRSDLYYKWLQSGGSGSTYTNAQRPVLQKTLKGLTEGTTNEKKVKEALKKAVDLVKHPLRTYLDVAGTISNVAEEATRVSEFKRALEKGKNEKTAALDSREITLDFSRGGKVAKDINKVVAFFNAELQGLDKMFTSFKERPLATTVKGLAYLTIPAMILRALQDEEKLDKVPQWEKDEYFIIFAGDTPIKIPKPQGLGQLFATIPERIIDFIKTQDKDAFDGLVQRLITSYIPIDSTTSIFPNFFLPLIENSANYSFFRQQPIVKQSLQNRSPKYQYDENTSTIAKKVGEVTNTSPKKIDNLISGYFGNLGKDIANIAGAPFDIYDSITDKNKDKKEYQSLNSKLKKIPVVKGFIASDTASKKIDEFYDDKAKASTNYTDAKFKYSEKEVTPKQKKELEYLKTVNSLYNKAYNDIKDIEEQIDDVSKSNRSNEYKKNMLEKLRKQKDKIAEDTKKEADKLKARNKLITQAEQKEKLK